MAWSRLPEQGKSIRAGMLPILHTSQSLLQATTAGRNRLAGYFDGSCSMLFSFAKTVFCQKAIKVLLYLLLDRAVRTDSMSARAGFNASLMNRVSDDLEELNKYNPNDPNVQRERNDLLKVKKFAKENLDAIKQQNIDSIHERICTCPK